jgi:(R,R)-butanediol dehydrogenase/meso-butanediol dehydrogenase/diacetyl reductase
MRALAARGTLVVVAVYRDTLPVPAMALMTSERRVIASFAYAPGTFEHVIDLISSGAFPTAGWVEHVDLDSVVHGGIAPLEAGTRMKVLVDLS